MAENLVVHNIYVRYVRGINVIVNVFFFVLSGPPFGAGFFVLSVPDVEYSWRSLLMTSERRETWPCRRHGCDRYRTFAIFLSGVKNCLLAGSWRLFFLRYAHNSLMHSARLASFLPTMSARSALSFMGLVSPDPLGMIKLVDEVSVQELIRCSEC